MSAVVEEQSQVPESFTGIRNRRGPAVPITQPKQPKVTQVLWDETQISPPYN